MLVNKVADHHTCPFGLGLYYWSVVCCPHPGLAFVCVNNALVMVARATQALFLCQRLGVELLHAHRCMEVVKGGFVSAGVVTPRIPFWIEPHPLFRARHHKPPFCAIADESQADEAIE